MTEGEYQGVERRHDSGQSEQFVVIKSWHTVIIVLTLIVTASMAYKGLNDANEDNARRIRELEQRPAVTRDMYDVGQQTIKERLDRIEGKLDSQDIRNFRSDADASGVLQKKRNH